MLSSSISRQTASSAAYSICNPASVLAYSSFRQPVLGMIYCSQKTRGYAKRLVKGSKQCMAYCKGDIGLKKGLTMTFSHQWSSLSLKLQANGGPKARFAMYTLAAQRGAFFTVMVMVNHAQQCTELCNNISSLAATLLSAASSTA